MTTVCNGLIENQPECEGLLLNYIEMLANLQQFEYEKGEIREAEIRKPILKKQEHLSS